MNLRGCFLSLFFVFFACGGEKNQTVSTNVEDPPGQLNPSTPLGKSKSKGITKSTNSDHEEEISEDEPEVESFHLTAKSKEISKAHFLLDLLRIQLNIKDSGLQNGNLQGLINLINEIKNFINKSSIDKTLLFGYLNKLTSYRGNLLLQTKFNTLGYDQLKDGSMMIQSDDLWLIEEDIFERFLKIFIRLTLLTKSKRVIKKKDLEEIVNRFENMTENYSDSALTSFLNFLKNFSTRKNNSSLDVRNIYNEILNLKNAISKLLQKLKEAHQGRNMQESEVALYLKEILGNGTYHEFLEDIKNLISLFLNGKPKEEIDKLLTKYDPKLKVKSLDFSGFASFFANKKAKWFDKVLDELINLLNHL